ncbi:uncharacterized protein SCHCODRAFT_02286911 [Schizophyllum commune H4-8]|uniref:uncharacterized protein n=1 Tax=Schizophyllum commune (strain H4-8 / FGSC 9210) TaxID=578458 RepID=UPI00215FC73A|nr:uncharacterized protein SCHCODRAFT_02286911 [Schizophyllum commune H4-8]KAI5892243.1 hypothetical protein SCHCODRAFT_02286911 [Schizophyllum commune H4-8]
MVECHHRRIGLCPLVRFRSFLPPRLPFSRRAPSPFPLDPPLLTPFVFTKTPIYYAIYLLHICTRRTLRVLGVHDESPPQLPSPITPPHSTPPHLVSPPRPSTSLNRPLHLPSTSSHLPLPLLTLLLSPRLPPPRRTSPSGSSHSSPPLRLPLSRHLVSDVQRG